jgi:hypothetical protein
LSAADEDRAAALVGDYLILGEAADVRRCLDARATARTLAASNAHQRATRLSTQGGETGVVTLRDERTQMRAVINVLSRQRALRTGAPTDAAALARYAQRCGVSRSLRALRSLGTGIAQLVTNTDPRDHLIAIARYSLAREASNAVGVHLYSFGGAVRTAAWMRELL